MHYGCAIIDDLKLVITVANCNIPPY